LPNSDRKDTEKSHQKGLALQTLSGQVVLLLFVVGEASQ
jgi:hypothetical protein